MKAAIPLLTVGGCSSLLCGDHLLNTALSRSISNIKELKEMLENATKLSSKVHRSSLACQAIMKECREIDCDNVKIISPAAKRWNSNYMMLESIVRMKRALIQLREKGNQLLEVCDNFFMLSRRRKKKKTFLENYFVTNRNTFYERLLLKIGLYFNRNIERK